MEGAETRVSRARLTIGVHTGKGGLGESPEQPHVADRRVRLPCEAGLLRPPSVDEKEGIKGPGPERGRLVETAHPPCLPLTSCSARSFSSVSSSMPLSA